MSRKPLYIVDSNVLIQAHRSYYSFDVCPGFWRGLCVHCGGKRIASIDKVLKEVENGANDALKEWATTTVPEEFFKRTEDRQVIKKFAEMVTWVQSSDHFTDPAKAHFANIADGWLVAYAACNDCVVVTLEAENSRTTSKIPIPNLCEEFSVKCANTFQMMRELKMKLALSTKRIRK